MSDDDWGSPTAAGSSFKMSGISNRSPGIGFGRGLSFQKVAGDVSTNGWNSSNTFSRPGGGTGWSGSNSLASDSPSDSWSAGGNSGGSSARGKGCFNCGEDGHMSKDCPNPRKSGSKTCHKCGEEGHFAKECTSGNRGGSGDRGCRKCGEEGHFARECPNNGSSRGGGGDRACRKCGEEGHFARECPNADAENPDRKPPQTYVPVDIGDDDLFSESGIHTGINFNKYDDIPVSVTGNDKPRPIMHFEDAGLFDTFLNNVKRAGYTKPTPVQKYAMPIIKAGRDLMACAQTGSGKTAAFLLPVLTEMINKGLHGGSLSMVQEPNAVVIAPTRELAKQIFLEARKFALGSIVKPCVAYGGTAVAHQLRQIEKGCNLLVATPGRLLDYVSKQKISLAKCTYLILDEADRMLDMGFIPDVRRIVQDFNMPRKQERQTLLFSATFPREIQILAADFMNDYLFVAVGVVGGANNDVKQIFFEVASNEKRDKLCELLSKTGTDRTLVFVERKRNADFLSSYLCQSGYPSTSIHGDREQYQREEALSDFRSNRAPILLATQVAARGLDIPDVKHVINYDLPSNIEEYVHRIGRTGRVGNLGKATSFYDSAQDRELASALVKVLGDAQQEVPEWLEKEAGSGMYGGGGGGGRGYGGRDLRGGRNNSDSNFGFNSTMAAHAEEEEW